MFDHEEQKFINSLGDLANCYGRTLEIKVLSTYWEDLKQYSFNDIEEVFEKCRRRENFFPRISKLLDYLSKYDIKTPTEKSTLIAEDRLLKYYYLRKEQGNDVSGIDMGYLKYEDEEKYDEILKEQKLMRKNKPPLANDQPVKVKKDSKCLPFDFVAFREKLGYSLDNDK